MDNKPNQKPNTPSPDSAETPIGKIIVPTLAIAVVIVLIAVLLSAGGMNFENLKPLVNNTVDGSAAGMSLVRPPLDDPNWKTLPGNLKTWDVKEGEGDALAADGTLECHYAGWLTNGESFDSSLSSGRSFTTALDSVVAGWKVGLVGIKVGGIRRLYIPSELGYGKQGSGKKIGPDQDLVFEVKCLKIVKKAPAGSSTDRSPSGMSTTLPSLGGPEWKDLVQGIKIVDVAPGEGPECPPNATVTIHYTGWTLNGVQFDSSVSRGEPTTFGLGSLIQGWQLAVPGMKPGGIRRMNIPWALAYGEAGRPPSIPAKADLIFEIKLIAHN
jgi:peptidylprolyl isomerase